MKHRTRRIPAVPAALAAVCLAATAAVTGCSSNFDDEEDVQQESGGGQHLTVLIATSGDAETQAVRDAAASFEEESGHTVTVEVARDINQQLGQAFAGGEPPDVFYVQSDQFATYAEGGSLYPYGDQIEDVDDFSASLRQSFTRDGELVCLPKDVSSLALVVNTELWQAAGLTEDDYPATWEDLERVARQLTGDGVTGLVTSDEYQRLGAFMKQAGGWITNPEQTEMTADSEENVEALEFVRGMLQDGSMAFARQLDAGWAGEVFGEGRAAMTIEGPWLAGAMDLDYPDVEYEVVPLPEGPAGPGTLAFTTCWGVARDSAHREAAVDLVRHFTEPEQQLAAAEAFGVVPSRDSAAADYLAEHPQYEQWGASGEWVQGPVTVAGFDQVLSQFNTDLQALERTDPRQILGDLQSYGEAALEESR